ncbi:MFS transporter [Streptosporangium sp. G11]|uniref:MFS transporter n=1 Tax=Streptosporangium sp. G11 TaxID=3436926 RepID=UPI003EBA9ACB
MSATSSGRSTPLVAVLAGAAFVASLTQTLVVPVLPTLPAGLGITGTQASWLVTVTVIVGAVANPLLGRLGDQFGRRRILLAAIAAFVAGSLVVALSGDIVVLILGRGVQGISTAAIPLGISVIASAVPYRRRAHGVAMVSAMLGIGGAVGLPLAGVISDAWGFHGLFRFAAVTGLVVLAAAWSVVPEVAPSRERGGIDYLGTTLLVAGLSALLLAIGQGQGWGWGSALTLGTLGSSTVMLVAFGVVELGRRHPVVDLRLAASRPILLTNVAGVLIGFALFTGMLGPITIAQLPPGVGFGLTVTAAGLCMLPGGVLMGMLSPFAARLIGRIGGRAALLIATVVILAGFGFRFVFDERLWQLVSATTVIFGGAAIAYAAMPSLILHATPHHQAGAANGLNALARGLGTALASAVFGAISSTGTPAASGFTAFFALGAGATIIAFVVVALLPAGGRAGPAL